MPPPAKTLHQQLVERALLIWTVREALELVREALLLVILLIVVLKTALMLL
jgi:hypothetical protein